MNTEKIKDALIKTFSSMLRTTESLSIGAEIENLIYDKDFKLFGVMSVPPPNQFFPVTINRVFI